MIILLYTAPMRLYLKYCDQFWAQISSPKKFRHWNRLLRQMIESLSLEVFKKCLDVVLKVMVYWEIIGGRCMIGLDDLGGLFQPW